MRDPASRPEKEEMPSQRMGHYTFKFGKRGQDQSDALRLLPTEPAGMMGSQPNLVAFHSYRYRKQRNSCPFQLLCIAHVSIGTVFS